MKECMKPHPTLHVFTGLGIGLLLVAILPSFAGSTGAFLGIIIIIASIAGHYVIKQENPKQS